MFKAIKKLFETIGEEGKLQFLLVWSNKILILKMDKNQTKSKTRDQIHNEYQIKSINKIILGNKLEVRIQPEQGRFIPGMQN